MSYNQFQLPRLNAFYRSYLNNHHTQQFVDLVSRHYNEGALQRLTGSTNTETRRAAVMMLGLLGSYQSNTVLGKLLHNSDRTVRLLAETSLKSVWTREGTAEQQQVLCNVLRSVNDGHYGEAVRLTNNTLDEFPFLVEMRNQRAIALFALRNFNESIMDSEIVLDLNPYHFGAAVGMGHAHLQLHRKENAVECFERALDINPNLENLRQHIAKLSVNHRWE